MWGWEPEHRICLRHKVFHLPYCAPQHLGSLRPRPCGHATTFSVLLPGTTGSADQGANQQYVVVSARRLRPRRGYRECGLEEAGHPPRPQKELWIFVAPFSLKPDISSFLHPHAALNTLFISRQPLLFFLTPLPP